MKNLKIFAIVTLSVFVVFFSAISIAENSLLKTKSQPVSNKKYSADFLNEIVNKVKNEYVEEKTDSQLIEAAASGILSSLDPHSSFLNEEDLKEINVHTKGEFGGIGIEISSEMSVTKVVSAIEDTPAFKAGINSGDYVIRVDDVSTQGLRIDEVVKKIRGKPNTSVKLTIYRKGETAPIEKTILRKIIKINPVKSNLFKDVAYIKINSFSEKTTDAVIKEFANIQKKLDKTVSLRGLVLDLRNNPGGLLDQSAEVADLFLPKGAKIVSIKGRDKTKIIEFIDDKPETLLPNLPIAVLINEGSASASEIVAGALQDNKRAIIMGSKSFGKGSVQSLIPLQNNSSAIKITTSLYYTPSGRSIQASGIEPDIELEIATIEKQKQNLPKDSEADLKGHIEVEINQNINKTAKNQDKKLLDSNLEIYQKDYQLGRAIDLIRGVSLSKAIFSGS